MKLRSPFLCVIGILITCAAVSSGQATKPTAKKKLLHESIAKTMDSKTARITRDRALDFLVTTQNKNGSWAQGVIVGLIDSGYSVASFYDWQYAASALACMSLLQCESTPERSKTLEQGLGWLTSSRIPYRGSDWDNDTVWAALCGVACFVEVKKDGRFKDTVLEAPIRLRARKLIHNLKRNQVPTGGWGYYDDKPYTKRPKWATSFSTAMILPTIQDALELGWMKDDKILARAKKYVSRCLLPNGAYQYDMRAIPRSPAGESIDNVKGSLGRMQVCNWALRATGNEKLVTLARVRKGLAAFMKFHRFLDVARMRPVPHEAYYANAGYFYYYGHYYASMSISLLPVTEQEAWHAQLRPHIVKTQRKNGSFCDFIGQEYMVVADTAYAIMTLNNGLEKTEAK
ncbi:MAG: hypothetical protein ACI97A_002886 [Planctomycetota bacterium]|jgi:hypothetical protein